MNGNYDACFCDSETVADPLYGMVEISAFEKRLLGCREMQRLRHIRQLGLANLVYPAAEHSRLTHSIGVCHQAKILVDRINANMCREARYREWRIRGFVNDTDTMAVPQPTQIAHVERVIISAAALLHDLPHAPFSHDIEAPSSVEPGHGLPSHDDFATNPAMFKYLFDKQLSQIARVISAYNHVFWKEGMTDQLRGSNWRDQIRARWPGVISNDGLIKVADESPISASAGADAYLSFPILGVMIFELHLIEKQDQWLHKDKDKKTKRIKGYEDQKSTQDVVTDWDDVTKVLRWRPLFGWFRPYRKEIIGNTICADLIDYIRRDGYNTGIISHVDLKFLDRMAITRAVINDSQNPEGRSEWDTIPITCEHVVFDVYDHKRGFVRQSIITEILSCLHARYLLCERVYQHRVAEGARAMLQHISQCLCETNQLSLKLIHSGNMMGDDAFLHWVCSIDDNVVTETLDREKVAAAKELAKMLLERRVYREAAIIDGIHGYETPGSMGGPERNCEALAEALLPTADKARADYGVFYKDLCANLRKKWQSIGLDFAKPPSIPALIGVREFGKRYKVPVVLVAKPFRYPERGAPLEVQPLFVCKDPAHIRDQLDAMKSAYDSLWRVYLFVHPGFHKRGKEEVDVHKYVLKQFVKYAKDQTKLGWRNSVEFAQLLPRDAIDIERFLYDEESLSLIVPLHDFLNRTMKQAVEAWLPPTSFAENIRTEFLTRCVDSICERLARKQQVVLPLNEFIKGDTLEKRFSGMWKPEAMRHAARKDPESEDIREEFINEVLKVLENIAGGALL